MAGPDLSAVASLLADRSRAAMLDALMSGEERAARTLAATAGVRASTASSHLQKLVDAGLITAVRRGRERHFRLASSEVADAMEALAVLAPAQPVNGLRDANRREALRRARTCYDHLAGALGVAVAEGLVRDGSLRGPELHLTRRGEARMADLGIDVADLRSARRPLTRACLDGTERRPHLAGALGRALTERFFDHHWVERIPETRAVRVTEKGRRDLLALDWAGALFATRNSRH